MADKENNISLQVNTNGGGQFGGHLIQNIVRVACVLFIINTIWIGWRQFGPQKPQADSRRRALAYETASVITEKIRDKRGAFKTISIQPFENDSTGALTEAVRAKILESGALDLSERTLTDKIRDFLNMRQYTSGDATEAIKLGKWKKSDMVLMGSIERFETVKGNAELILNYSLLDVVNNVEIYKEKYDTTTIKNGVIDSMQKETARYLDSTGSNWSNLNRLLGWCLIVLLLPIFTIKFLITMTAKRSNSVNALTLGFYTVIDIIFALILVKPESNTLGVWSYFALFCAAAFLYNVKIMTMAHRAT